MNAQNDEKLRALLKRAIPPASDAELKRDLWPQMLQRLNEPAMQVPWFDWALLALVLVWFFLFPEAIPVLLYHL